MFPEVIVIRGAKEHNLKKVDITLPRHKLIVFTGAGGEICHGDIIARKYDAK